MPARRHFTEATLVRIGGGAGVAGGLCWVVKSGSILATGIQPPLMYELALPLLAAGLVGVAHLVLLTGQLCLGLVWTSIGLMTLRRSVDALTRAG